jgi:general nucleoside transport system ATP-binding protein
MQQRVEILKILFRNSRIMIFDEPTAVLTPNEIKDFFKIIKRFKEEDKTIIFITHKLNEVMEICDSVTVLRDGEVIGNVDTADTGEAELANMMVGREISLREANPAKNIGEIVLEVKNLCALDNNKQIAVNNISFSVSSGEILGIAGVDGNGQMELGNAITGMHPVDSGHVYISGTETTNCSPEKLLAHGMSYIPADRHKTGLILDFTVAENLASKEISQKRFTEKGFLRLNSINKHSDKMIHEYDIRGAINESPAKQLSGGNQQKIILAREFDRDPQLIVAILPTRGLDISAVDFVRKELIKKRNEGAAILLISTELEEVLALADRIEVI